ncbi:MAG: protein O-mannosyl-transferase family [Anaerolineae bacterium]
MKTHLTRRAPAWFRGIPGAVIGLFLARVALEATWRPCPGVLVVTVGLLAALGGFALAQWLAQRRKPLVISHWSLVIGHWPLIIYFLWPRRAPVVAASVAVLAALVWLLSGERSSLPWWAEQVANSATFVIALVVYVATAAPDVLPADAGEFQWVAARMGVAHPPGFPLYMLVGHLFIRLFPWGTPAYRLNLMSGLLAAGTLVLIARATRLWARRLGASPLVALVGGLAAALTLGSATTFWAQATIANIRTPAVFLAALALYTLARLAAAEEQREVDRALILLALALGLGGGHYPPLAFISLFFALYVLLTDPCLVVQPRRWWRPLLVGLVSFLLPLAYMPIRGLMGAPQASSDLATLPGFLNYFLARGFAGDMFAFANATDLPHRLALVPTLFPFQFNTFLLTAALLGLLGLVRRDWRLFVLLAGSLVLHTFVTITYRAPQTVEYLMPAYLPIAIAVGLLPSLIFPHSYMPALSHTSTLLCALVLCAGLLNAWTHAPSFIELARDRTARQTVEPLLEQAPAGALILADWRWYTPLSYLQRIEGLRPDVEVRYVYNVPGEEYRDTWLRRIQDADQGRLLLLTHFYEFVGYTTEPWETGFLIRPRPVTEPAAPLVPLDLVFGDQVRLIGYRLHLSPRGEACPEPVPSGAEGQGRREAGGGVYFHPGQVAEIILAWRAAGPLTPPPSFTLVLLDAEGRRVAQADRALPTGLAPGEVRFERLALPLYPMLSPGRYQMTLGAYTVSDTEFEIIPADDGQAAVTLTRLELEPSARAPFTLHPQSVPFQGGPTLVGVDYDRSVPDTLRVYLRWRGPIDQGIQAQVWVADGPGATTSLPSIPAGAYQTVAVDLPGVAEKPLWVSLTDGQGHATTAAGPWAWPVSEMRLPVPAPDARFVPLGDEMALVGVKARPAGPGETMVVDVTLVALRPLTDDDATSVRVMNGAGQWVAHDMQPALGAVPTLKWIRGSRVVDRHLLPLPEDFAAGEVWATLVAYERFRMTSLTPMDGRFGPIPLGTWAAP